MTYADTAFAVFKRAVAAGDAPSVLAPLVKALADSPTYAALVRRAQAMFALGQAPSPWEALGQIATAADVDQVLAEEPSPSTAVGKTHAEETTMPTANAQLVQFRKQRGVPPDSPEVDPAIFKEHPDLYPQLRQEGYAPSPATQEPARAVLRKPTIVQKAPAEHWAVTKFNKRVEELQVEEPTLTKTAAQARVEQTAQGQQWRTAYYKDHGH